MRILYVEDNVDDADLTVRALQKQAPTFVIDTVTTLAEARDLLFAAPNYDLLLADLRLPDGNGIDLLLDIRKQALPISVVIITGSEDEETAVAALRAGADDYLSKSPGYRKHLFVTLESAWTRFQAEFSQKTGTLHVLYVETQSADTELMQRHLDRFAPHIHLKTVYTSEEAITRLSYLDGEAACYDMLLLDYRLPGINGLELIKKLRDEHHLTLPVVIITEQGNEEIAIQAMRLGAADYLVRHKGYLHKLPIALENAYYRSKLIQEQNALRESELRFRRLTENARDIIFRIRILPERKYEYVSPVAYHITGYLPKEYYADPDLGHKIAHPDDRAKLAAADRGELPFDQPLTIHWIHKNGQDYWTEQRNVPVYDAEGNVIAIEGISRDITESKKAEEENRLQSAALNSAANAIVITDPEGEILWGNPAFLSLTGYSIKELIGKNPRDVLKSGMQDKLFFKEMWETILSGKVWHGELVNRRKDGSLYPEEMTITPLKNADGDISHFIAIKQDISERKKAEDDRVRLLAQVREQANRIQKIMDTVPESVLLISDHGQILSANPMAKRDLTVLSGDPEPLFITHLGDLPLVKLFESSPSNGWHEIEVRGRHYAIIARPMEDNLELNYWVLVINDVTEERVYQRYQQAQERLATVGQLAAGIAHDFNNVMGVIMLYSQMLRDIPNLSDKNRRQLDLISDRAQHATNLIAQILDFGRRSVLDMAPLNLRPLFKEMITLLSQTLPESISLRLSYDQNDCIIHADPTRIQQVIMNLAINARDAMPNGGKLQFKLSSLTIAENQDPPLPDMEKGEWVQLSVSDSGTGIKAEHLPHIFEPFFSTKAPGRGTGLGLAQVYGIIKQHNGSINVVSEAGVGTTFNMYIPLLHVPAPSSASSPKDEFLPGGNEKILLVEDDLAMQQTVSEALSLLGYTIFTASNGIEAVKMLNEKQDTINLIISDLIMPEMGGVELYQQVRLLHPSTKMVVMTGYAAGANSFELLKDENILHIQKPFKLSELAQMVQTVLNQS